MRVRVNVSGTASRCCLFHARVRVPMPFLQQPSMPALASVASRRPRHLLSSWSLLLAPPAHPLSRCLSRRLDWSLFRKHSACAKYCAVMWSSALACIVLRLRVRVTDLFPVLLRRQVAKIHTSCGCVCMSRPASCSMQSSYILSFSLSLSLLSRQCSAQ